jgi:hypothetical protein
MTDDPMSISEHSVDRAGMDRILAYERRDWKMKHFEVFSS